MTWRADKERTAGWILLAPALFVLAEYVRTLGPLGTGFSMIHQALYRIPWLIQSAATFGSWSVTTFVVAINAALFVAWRKKPVRFVFLAVGLLAVQGAFRLLPVDLDQDAPSLAVAIVSSNIDQEVKLDAGNLDALTDRFLNLGERAIATNPDLVVFPESFLPAYILDHAGVFSRLADLADRGNASLLFGTGTYRNGEVFNSIVLIDSDGEIRGTYDMVRPVPFGEYIPGRAILEAIGLGPWARSLLPLDLSRGSSYDPIDGIGTPICFESTFPTASRRLASAGAMLFVTVTNDAWFAGSSELRAHFSTAVFRAVENRRSVVQAANGGVSGFVDLHGRILSETSAETISTETVRLSTSRSIYTQWGDGPLVVLSACVAFGLLGLRLVRRNRRPGA